MSISNLVIAASLALPLLATPAFAEGSLEVRYGDLDITRAEDAAILANRIDEAARELCARKVYVTGSRLPLASSRRQQELCRESSVNAALERLNAPLVTRAYAQSMGGRRDG